MLIDSLLSGQDGAFLSALSHLILPTIVLGTIPLATIARMTRSAMLEVLGEDYVRTARAKGLSPFRVVGIHALRNALIPVVTVIGLQVGTLMAGAVLTEYIFSWPGIGTWLIESIQRRDYPALQGGVLLISGIVILINISRRPALRRAQPEDPPCPLTTTRQPSGRIAVQRRPAPFAAFFRDFSENRAALLGLILLEPAGLRRDLRQFHRAARPSEQFRDFVRVSRRSGPRAATPPSRSAPTTSAATCSRA